MADTNLAVIGAGPAGMAAAITAAQAGLSVTLLDEQPSCGGQIYRNIEHTSVQRASILGKDYMAGRKLADELTDAKLSYVSQASVWHAGQDGTLHYSRQGAAFALAADRILIATGALERPVPIPGWTLPGVMMAGAGQVLLKQSGLVAKGAVLAGCGPLLYLIAAQMVRAGRPPLALVETQRRTDMLRAQKHLAGALRGWRYLAKGLGLIAELRRAGVMRYQGASELRVEGKDCAEALVFEHQGQTRRLACETVFLHMGVVPNVQLSRALGLDHQWDPRQLSFQPMIDQWGRTSAERVFVAGDGAGIAGATSAELAGRIAALKIASDLQRIDARAFAERSAPLLRSLATDRAVRPFLDTAYPPAGFVTAPRDETIVCRCEEVTAGDVRRYATLGCQGPNQTKAFGRSGMGPCQGRYCGLTVSMLLAQANTQSVEQTGYYRIRTPIKPLTLGELAQLDETCGGGKGGIDLG